jgi:hypothetical protein
VAPKHHNPNAPPLNISGQVQLLGKRDLVESLRLFINGQTTRHDIQAEDPALPYDRELWHLRCKWLALPKCQPPAN